MLDDVTVTNDWIVVQDREDVLSRLSVYDKDGKRIRELPLPVFGNVTGSSYDYATDTIYATLASHTAPYKVYSLGGKALDWNLVWQDDPPLDLSQIVAERVYVPAKDGTKIPVFIARRKDSKLDGANPTLLNGYGGFNIAVAPFYLGSYSSFINRGGILVDAGIRGGSEYGERWHEQAMFGRKQTTFDDMIAVAEWLIAQKYTQPSKLAVAGGSNGGLTVGAVITQRPDLFRAAICQVPLLDMVRFHKFLIARYWIAEYGDPDQSDAFRWILRYSPYQNVRQGVNLPETLVVAGEFDSRVDPLHAKKFAALVQNNPGQVSPFLLYMDFDSGHGSGKTNQQRVIDRDYELRFLMNALGMNALPRRPPSSRTRRRPSSRARATLLPPRFVHGHGDGIGQVDAAHAGPHRDAQPCLRRKLGDDRVRQPGGLAAEDKNIPGHELRVVKRARAGGRQREETPAVAADREPPGMRPSRDGRRRARTRGSRGPRASIRDRPSGSRAARPSAARSPYWR